MSHESWLHEDAVQDRSANVNELPAKTQNLRGGHNSAPQATQTPQLRRNKSPQPGEHVFA